MSSDWRQMKLLLLKAIYFEVLVTALILLLSGCCPGIQNATHSRIYTAMDFMKYSCSESCILSKLDYYESTPYGYNGLINVDDSIILEFKNSELTYLHFAHYEGGEEVRELFNFYMMRLQNEKYYQYLTPAQFTVQYYGWQVHVYLTANAVDIVGKRL